MTMEPGKIDQPFSNISVCCLMLTPAVPERWAFFKRNIDSFCRQTLSNKTLVIVVDGGDERSRRARADYVESLGREDIRVFILPDKLNLGQLRNFSLEVATGDILCQWDDDDLYHPQRLEKQLAALLEGDFEAIYFQDVMQYFPSQNLLYWTNWHATEVAGHPGTLMVRREVPMHYPTEGESAHLGEDTQVALSLIARGRVGYLAGQPHLYIYVSHGANTWHDAQHRMLADELSISRGLLSRREAQIREGLMSHGFSPGTIAVTGSNGTAFIL